MPRLRGSARRATALVEWPAGRQEPGLLEACRAWSSFLNVEQLALDFIDVRVHVSVS